MIYTNEHSLWDQPAPETNELGIFILVSTVIRVNSKPFQVTVFSVKYFSKHDMISLDSLPEIDSSHRHMTAKFFCRATLLLGVFRCLPEHLVHTSPGKGDTSLQCSILQLNIFNFCLCSWNSGSLGLERTWCAL